MNNNISATLNDITNSNLSKKSMSYRLSKWRWWALALSCFLVIGFYFSFDNPSALQAPIQNDMNLTTTQFNWLYSIYALPNIVLPIFSGLIIDRIGVRVGIFLFSFFLIIGQFVVYLGTYVEHYWIMLFGRFIFGLGGESLNVAQSVIVAKWFGQKELAFALAMNTSSSRIASTINSSFTPWLYTESGLLWLPMLIGFFLCIFSWFCGLWLNHMDKTADQDDINISLQDSETNKNKKKKISLNDLKHFNSLFWILVLDCVILHVVYYGFSDNANDILITRFGFTSATAGYMTSIVFIMAVILTPLFGILVDIFGYRGWIMLCSSVLAIIAHILISCLNDTVTPNYNMIISMIIVGLFYSSFSAIIWPCFPLIVENYLIGTAFGLVTAIEYTALMISPIIIGQIHDNTTNIDGGYFWTEIYLVGMGIIGFFVNLLVNLIDLRTENKLNGIRKEKVKANEKMIFEESFTSEASENINEN